MSCKKGQVDTKGEWTVFSETIKEQFKKDFEFTSTTFKSAQN